MFRPARFEKILFYVIFLKMIFRQKGCVFMSFGSVFFGAIIGGFIAGPIGALVGGGIGLLLSNSTPKKRQQTENQPNPSWLIYFFMCLGKLAKSDGRVSRDEAEFVKSIMKEWKLSAETRQELIHRFNEGRDSTESFASLAEKLARAIPPYSADAIQLRYNLTTLFCALVAVDRIADPSEIAMLRVAGNILNATHIVNNFFADFSDYKKAAEPKQKDSLADCYKILEISPDATDQEVKKAFRKKALSCHPDKIQGAGLSNEQIQRAKEKFQQISNAYETICKHRGIK